MHFGKSRPQLYKAKLKHSKLHEQLDQQTNLQQLHPETAVELSGKLVQSNQCYTTKLYIPLSSGSLSFAEPNQEQGNFGLQ